MLLSLYQVGDDNDTGRRCNRSVAGRGNVQSNSAHSRDFKKAVLVGGTEHADCGGVMGGKRRSSVTLYSSAPQKK